MTKPYQDKETLERLYYDEELNQIEIADELDCSQITISRWMRKLDIETDDRRIEAVKEARRVERATFETNEFNGYEYLKTRSDGDMVRISVHRLVAIAKYGTDAVKDMVVHHKNGVPWDNRPQNLEIMTDSEHKSHHAKNRERIGGEFV